MLTSLFSFPDDGRSFRGWMFLTNSVAELTSETTSLERKKDYIARLFITPGDLFIKMASTS